MLPGIGLVTLPEGKDRREVFTDQVRELDALEAEWNGIVTGDLAALGRKAKEANLDPVVVPVAAAR